MTVRVKYRALSGGLDLASSALAIKASRMAQCLNFEEVFGTQGYRSIYGYERFDGRASPSGEIYTTMLFDAGTIAIAAGDIVTNATTATAEVVSVTLASGSWAGGDAAGTIIVTLRTNNWADNDPIRVGGVQRATANGVPRRGSPVDTNYSTNLLAAWAVVRAKIQKVPGEGSVLGVAVYRATVYAVRNIVGSASATLWKSSAAGWVSVKTGLIPSGAWKFKVANFSGASTTLALFGVDGKNRLLKWDGATATKAAPIQGSEATSVSSVTVGTGAKTFTIAEASRNWVVGTTVVTVWDADNAANSFTGTVTAYNAGTGVTTVTATTSTGAGTITNWEVAASSFSDKPFDLTAHKDHMWLAYPLGQLQTSNLGDPMVYTSTAALFGLGSELTGMVSLKGALLGVFCREKIEFIAGTSALDWDKQLHTEGAGAISGTIGDNVGNALFLDDKGVMSLQATQAFGSFEPAVLSRDIKKYLDTKISDVVGARMVRGYNQYRLYFNDGSQARFTIMNGNPVLQPKDVSPSRQTYNHVPTCFASGVMSSDSEALFFGTTDGYVMQEDSGANFDGDAIPYVTRLPFDHFDSPEHKKRYHKLEFELECTTALDISFRQFFDYDDTFYMHSTTQVATAESVGGQFDAADWDTFTFDNAMHSKAEVNVAGVGRNMALLLFVTSAVTPPFTLQGITTQFSVLGMKR